MHRSLLGAWLVTLVFQVVNCSASVVTFETTPGGMTPVDDAALMAPYSIVGGGTVMFFFDVNGNNAFDPGTDGLPVFERTGGVDPNSGFVNGLLGLDDTANGGAGPQLGTWFLRQLQPGAPPPAFIVDYNTAQTISACRARFGTSTAARPRPSDGWSKCSTAATICSIRNSLRWETTRRLTGCPGPSPSADFPVASTKCGLPSPARS